MPAYRFLDEALRCSDTERTDLRRRALITIDMLNQAWASWEPDVSLLNHAIALEILLGEPRGSGKKVRIGRLDLTAEEEGAATWFIASRLLLTVLNWFEANPQSDLSELDAQIGTLPLWQPT